MLGFMEFHLSKQGHTKDPGYFLCRAVLGFLALGKVSEARICLDEFITLFRKEEPESIIPDTNSGTALSKYPLMNYSIIILKQIEHYDGRLFSQSINHFQEHLRIDDYLLEV